MLSWTRARCPVQGEAARAYVPGGRQATGATPAATKNQKNVDAQIQEAVEAVAKARGTKLGNPRPNLAKAAAASAKRAARFRTDVLPLLQSFRAGGTSYRRIAATLNERQIPTLNGPSWHAATVRGALLRAQ